MTATQPQPRPIRLADGYLKSLAQDARFATEAARVLGTPDPERDVTTGQPFDCTIPSHAGRGCTASIKKYKNGYKYSHHDGTKKKSYYLARIYHAKTTCTDPDAKVSKQQLMAYVTRLVVEAGFIGPYPIVLPPLPDDASEDDKKAYEGIKLHLGCAWLRLDPGTEMAFVFSFGGPWSGIPDQERFDKAMRNLVRWGIVRQIPRDKHLLCYLPCV